MFKKIANNGIYVAFICGTTLWLGTLMYKTGEQQGWLDSAYWASTTMTTVGYGDMTPKTDFGKIFAILYQMWSIIVVLPLTIAWVLGKVNQDLFTDSEQKGIDAKLDRIERKLNG